ncbi:MAG: hypothetical protein JXL97_10180 [Bacteroidales bacterium]|nr:hypothetical protein [Bacteroidales bacterium]
MLNNKIFLKLFFVFFIISNQFVFAQSNQVLDNQIIDVVEQFVNMKNTKSDPGVKIIAFKVDSLYSVLLSNPNSFNDSLAPLKEYSSILTSDDGKVKIITWNIFFKTGEYFYYGYVQYLTGKENEFHFVKLLDKSAEINKPEMQDLLPEKWYGCLYYQIVTTKYKKEKLYTLLGWDGNSFITNKKIIDVLTIRNGKVKFGAAFEIAGEKSKRVIFEYTNQASMTLRWDEREKMIIWDHLAPESPKYEGIYEFYGPDFTHDAVKFKKGKWLFQEDIYVENPKE